MAAPAADLAAVPLAELMAELLARTRCVQKHQVRDSGGAAGSSLGDDGRGTWRHEWVVTLVHAKGASDQARKSGMVQQRQGRAEWKHIVATIVVKHPSFDKDDEACRQKYKRLDKAYKEEKTKRATSGQAASTLRGRAAEVFDIIDSYKVAKPDVSTTAHLDSGGCSTALSGMAPRLEASTSQRKRKADAQATDRLETLLTQVVKQQQADSRDFKVLLNKLIEKL